MANVEQIQSHFKRLDDVQGKLSSAKEKLQSELTAQIESIMVIQQLDINFPAFLEQNSIMSIAYAKHWLDYTAFELCIHF